MEKLIFSLLLFASSLGVYHAQQDTLYEENIRKVGDIIFKNLNPNLYGPSLLNRSFSTSDVVFHQVRGSYNRVYGLEDVFEMYQDIAFSYVDSTYMYSIQETADLIDSLFYAYEIEDIEDENGDDMLFLPFAFLYHNVSIIDSMFWNESNFIADSFSYVCIGNEQSIYRNVTLKSCGVVEFFEDSGYAWGYLKYEPQLISVSPDIQNLTLKIDVGEGFVDFNQSNSQIMFLRNSDSLIGSLALEFIRDSLLQRDTLRFYLTTKLNENDELRGKKRWDDVDSYSIPGGRVKLRYGIKWGCGNTKKEFRRPIIIIPPYRPGSQPVSLNNYYDQFNFASMIEILSEAGYDVIFVKLKPGNRKLEDASMLIQNLIAIVNNQKTNAYPNESWENVLMGFSMGGQIARHALKRMEYLHMTIPNVPHHHTRLFIPFDSPNQGANIPMFTQFVYKDLKGINFFASLSYNSLTDEASKDMGICHILGSPMYESPVSHQKVTVNEVYFMNGKTYSPGITSERQSFLNSLNSLHHTFTPINDLRKAYPTFTRNVAVSVGGNVNNYNDEYQLNRGKRIYGQDGLVWTFLTPANYIPGIQFRYRQVYASKYANNAISFVNRMENRTLLIPIVFRNNIYRMNYGYEWDMAQGGYKDEFWDKNGLGIIPVGAVPLLNTWGIVNTNNNKLYFDHMGFMPMLSSLHINPDLWNISEQYWQNNLKFNLKTQGLMYNSFNSLQNDLKSNTYGYPNLGHPNTHFNITPFEAIYCDIYTYEHIKMQASVEENGYDDVFLVHTRNFVVNEIESDVVYLQNKIIGKNHVQNVPSYKYKAWYKAYTRIEIGNLVSPKTDPGDYIIEKTGDITVYAGETVVLRPGFHAQNGSTFHAFIKKECAKPPENVPVYTTVITPEVQRENETLLAENQTSEDKSSKKTENKVLDSGLAVEYIDNASQMSKFSSSEIPENPKKENIQSVYAIRLDEE